MERRQYNLDIHFKGEVMAPDEVAKFFKKSTSWVYKNWKILGGVKLGGSLFFPNQEEMYSLLFEQRKPVGSSLHQKSRSRKIWFKVKIKIKRVEINNWEKLKRLPPAKKAQTGMAFSGHVNRMPQQSLVPHSPLLLNSFLLTMTGKMSGPIDNNTPARVLFVFIN